MFRLPAFLIAALGVGPGADPMPQLRPADMWRFAPMGRSRGAVAQDKRRAAKMRARQRAKKHGHA